MSLIKTFPEVELFFENDSFSHEELMSFIQEVENKYEDQNLRKSIATLIKLKILQFDISEAKESKQQNLVQKRKKISDVPTKTVKYHPLLESLKHNSIENIAINIKWTATRLQRLLLQNGITKSVNEILTLNEFEIVKNMINSRLWGLERTEKQQNLARIGQKSSKKYTSKEIGVYGKIQTLGLGKLIYIRKK